jgi:hypothetical protein
MQPKTKFPAILRILIGLAYLGIGGFVWQTKHFVVKLSETAAFALGAVIIAYGLFRLYMAYQHFKNL